MTDHRYIPTTERCAGCGVARAEVVERAPKLAACPAFYAKLSDGTTAIVTPAEEVVLWVDRTLLVRFPKQAGLDLRTAIGEGVRHARGSKSDFGG